MDEFILADLPLFVVNLPRPNGDDEEAVAKAILRLRVLPAAAPGGTAVPLFTDSDLAEVFAAAAAANGVSAEPLPCEDWTAFELLLHALARQGETHLVIDPDPEFRRNVGAQPIALALAALRRQNP